MFFRWLLTAKDEAMRSIQLQTFKDV